jgi:hypothetical protein
MVSMLKVLVLVVAVGALVFVATGRVDDLRSEVSALRDPFDALNEALTSPALLRENQKKAWDAVAKEANSICARYQQDDVAIRLALPRNRADFVRALGIALEREHAMQADLSALTPPPNYHLSYSKFLHDRQVGLVALERFQRAAKEKDRKGFVLAARAIVRRSVSIDAYVQSARMPACTF